MKYNKSIIKKKYSASFTIGGLLLNETIALLPLLFSEDIDNLLMQEQKNNNLLKTQSESSRAKYIREIRKRVYSINIDFWNNFENYSDNEKKIVIYYSCCCCYSVLKEFHEKKILNKWNMLHYEITKQDFLTFLDEIAINDVEIDSWTANTREKLAGVVLLMLKEAGFLFNNKLQKIQVSDNLLKLFIENDSLWFLDFIFLTKEEKQLLIQSL